MAVLKLQSDGRITEAAAGKMAKPPWVHGRGLDTFFARRAFNCSKGASWRKCC